MQIHKHVLIALLSLVSYGVMGSDCAILATGAASDLAIDDPERFEHLTRVCRGESATKRTTNSPDRSSPATTLRSPGASEKPARPVGKPKNQATSDDSSRKKNIGCDFLFYPVSGSKHPIDTEACKDGENLTCKRIGANGAQWVKGGTACTISPDAVHNSELNLKNANETLNKMKDLYD